MSSSTADPKKSNINKKRIPKTSHNLTACIVQKSKNPRVSQKKTPSHAHLPVKILTLLPVQPSVHRAEHDLENTVACQMSPGLTCERDSVDNIPHITIARNFSELVIQLLQGRFSLLIATDLEKLDADLPGGCVELVQLLGGLDQRTLNVVAWFAIRDADDVHGLGCLGRIGVLAQIWSQDLVQTLAGWSTATRSHRIEDLSHSASSSDIVMERRVAMVEEVDVDAVSVVRRADWSDGLKCFASLAPKTACHGSAVVDEEDSVEGVEKCIRVVGGLAALTRL